MNVFRLCKILNRKRINKEEMRYNAIKIRDNNKNKYESKYFDHKINSSQNNNTINQYDNNKININNNQHNNTINQHNYNYNNNNNIKIKINNNLVYSKSGILQNNNDSFIRHPEIFLTMKKTRSCKKYLQNYRFLEDVVEQRRLVQNGFKTKIDKQQNINKYSFNTNNSNFNYQKMSNDFNDEFMTSKNYKQYDNFSKNCKKDVYGMPIDQFSFKQIRIQDLYTKIIKSITENITFLIMFNFLETKDYSGLLFRSLENVLPIYLISGYIYLCRYLKYKMNSLRDLSKIFFICCWISAKTTHDKHVPFDEMFINTDICTKDISYLEAHILFKINYDIEIYQEEVLRYIW